MSAFESQWADWEPKGPTQRTDKTDRSAFVSSVSASPRRIWPLDRERSSQKRLRTLTDKTDKRSVDGSVVCPPGGHVVLLQAPDGVPSDWVQGVADLLAMPAHPGRPEGGWKTLQADALTFLKDWAAQAHALGWEALDLFGVHAEAPYARLDGMGLVPLLGGRPVVALTEDSAAIGADSGGTLTFRRRRGWPLGRCLIWDLK